MLRKLLKGRNYMMKYGTFHINLLLSISFLLTWFLFSKRRHYNLFHAFAAIIRCLLNFILLILFDQLSISCGYLKFWILLETLLIFVTFKGIYLEEMYPRPKQPTAYIQIYSPKSPKHNPITFPTHKHNMLSLSCP